MNITLAGSATTYTPNDEQLGRVSLEFAAFDGEVGTGTLPVPDAAAGLTVVTGRQAKVEEIGTLVTDGFALDQDRVRGPEPAGTAREYTFGVMDANALLHGFRLIQSRPSETDYARVIALAAIYGPTWDTTWVLNSSTISMPAKRYDTDGGFAELITDTVEFTGKTMFLHDKALGGRCLHYHVLTTGHTSGLVITDAAGVADGITSYKPQQPSRQRTSVDLINNVKGRDQSGRTSTQTDATSITAHNVDGLGHQALIEFEATSQADLDAKTAAFLASYKDDQDTYNVAIGPLDATALARIRVGDYITTTSSVLGLTASAQRIAHMTQTVYTGTGVPAPGLWNALLELSAPTRRRARVKPSTRGALIPGQAPWAGVGFGVCTPYRDTFSRIVAAGSWGQSEINGMPWNNPTNAAAASVNGSEGLLVVTGTVATHASAQIDLNLVYPIHLRTLQKVTGPDSGAMTIWLSNDTPEAPSATLGGLFVSLQYTAGGSPNPFAMVVSLVGDMAGGGVGGTTNPLGASDPSGQYFWVDIVMTATAVSIRCYYDGFPVPAFTDYGPTASSTTPPQIELDAETLNPVGTTTARWAVTQVEFLCDEGPVVAQRIPAEFVFIGDGISDTFQLQYPYLPGSISIEVDGTDQDVTETDPATGDIALTFVPVTGERVTADYQRGI